MAAVSAADRFVNECCDYRPNHGRDQAVRVRLKVRVDMLPCVKPLITRSFSIPSKTKVAQM